ncbi:MAG: preprotein translocase subunit SecA [Halobacteriovoraceae bacterium]|nr:preprotein translocase subunit SecA [Halobacteriovoraceae bacterium]
MLDLFKGIIGTKHDRDIKAMRPLVEKINSLEKQMQSLSDDDLYRQTEKFKQRHQNGEKLQSILPEAFATVREASVRVLKMRHFDVQLMGGFVLFNGKIAEMKTGEGKTLTATLPLYLHGLSGKGGHLVTVNDYLAKRDAEWMGELLQKLNLTVGTVISDISDEERHKAYRCDVTYGTNNEFAFDYLRDNMKFRLEDYVQREHNYCIVDEVDSILIDEARTPLLISGPSEGSTQPYLIANKIIPQLSAGVHFTIDEKARSAILTDDGIIEVQKMLKINNLFKVQHAELLHLLNQSLKAHHLFKKDVDYVVRNGQVIIVDEFTGRLKEGSRWSDGLHQSVEAKEGVPIKSENQTLASITFQNYFRLYKGLAGMTGTADTEAEEFGKIYNLDVVVIPTNLPMVRDDQADVIYKNKNAKISAIVKLITELSQKGQPVLVGTISIENSEIISKALKRNKIPHEVLNAKQHEREAQIVTRAGEEKAVTIATNMAGRGTDIKLTEETKKLGGLFILGTERHESRRIDNQLRGRSGRQGDPGSSKFFLSLEDDLMRIFGSGKIQGIMHTLGMKEDEPIEHRMITRAIAKAQKKVETHNFEIRKHLLEYDNVMNEQRRVIYRLRREILSGKENRSFVDEMVEDVTLLFIDTYRPERKVPVNSWSWEEINKGFKTTFNTDRQLNADECINNHDENVDNYIVQTVKQVLSEKLSSYDEEQVNLAICEILLSIFDKFWKDHLLSMDHLKEGINLRAYAQKDPLTEYKREAFSLFENMRVNVKRAVVESMFTVKLYSKEEIEELKRKQQEFLEAQMNAHQNARKIQEGSSSKQETSKKVGRNQPCPCGSGKKYKHCHGA